MGYDNRDRTGGEDGPRDAPQDGINTDLVSMLIGYARVSTERQDLTAQRHALLAIAAELASREVALSLGGTVYDPTDPVGKLMFTTLAMVA